MVWGISDTKYVKLAGDSRGEFLVVGTSEKASKVGTVMGLDIFKIDKLPENLQVSDLPESMVPQPVLDYAHYQKQWILISKRLDVMINEIRGVSDEIAPISQISKDR